MKYLWKNYPAELLMWIMCVTVIILEIITGEWATAVWAFLAGIWVYNAFLARQSYKKLEKEFDEYREKYNELHR